MKSLPILWQRLVSSDGKTCDRCRATQEQIRRAVGKLKKSLRPVGLEPILKIKKISAQSFKENPSESNRIWIAGKAMEFWLGARVGSSRCCSVCGDSQCRTIELGSAEFETIPERLIVKAALAAAAELTDVKPGERGHRKGVARRK